MNRPELKLLKFTCSKDIITSSNSSLISASMLDFYVELHICEQTISTDSNGDAVVYSDLRDLTQDNTHEGIISAEIGIISSMNYTHNEYGTYYQVGEQIQAGWYDYGAITEGEDSLEIYLIPCLHAN